MIFSVKDLLLEETNPAVSERGWSQSIERDVQEKVFTVLTLSGNIVLIPESDLDRALVRGGRVLPDGGFP